MAEPLKIAKFVCQVVLGILLIVGGITVTISDERIFSFMPEPNAGIKAIGVVVMIIGAVLLKSSVTKEQ